MSFSVIMFCESPALMCDDLFCAALRISRATSSLKDDSNDEQPAKQEAVKTIVKIRLRRYMCMF